MKKKLLNSGISRDCLKDLENLPEKLKEFVIEALKTPSCHFDKDLKKQVEDLVDPLKDDEDLSKGKHVEYRLMQGPKWTIVGDLKISAPVDVQVTSGCSCCRKGSKHGHLGEDDLDFTHRAFPSSSQMADIEHLIKLLSRPPGFDGHPLGPGGKDGQDLEYMENDDIPLDALNHVSSSLLQSYPDPMVEATKPQYSQSNAAKLADALFSLNRKGKVSSDRPNIKGLKLSETIDLDYWHVMINLSPTSLVVLGHSSYQRLNKAVVLVCNNNGLQISSQIDIPCSDKYNFPVKSALMITVKSSSLLILAREYSILDILGYNPSTNQLRIIRAEHFVVPISAGQFYGLINPGYPDEVYIPGNKWAKRIRFEEYLLF